MRVSFFHRVGFIIYSFLQSAMKLFKSYETQSYSSSSHVYSKRISNLACVEKKFVLSLFSYEISEFSFFFIYSFFQNVGKSFTRKMFCSKTVLERGFLSFAWTHFSYICVCNSAVAGPQPG